ncbi:MAG: C69 family dipeptidase [Phycisphaerales bacterium]|nr:MAG: C69 family dipeptidase [Phycisphaerales bacterium]
MLKETGDLMSKTVSTLTCLAVVWAVALSVSSAWACTSILVSKGASADGSVIITYACDGEFHPHLRIMPAADYEPGEMLKIEDWSGNIRGEIEQVEHTYKVVGLMNEHQLAIGESTFGGREDLHNPGAMLHYWDLMRLSLQRAKTAREAITVMTELVAKYGYRSLGESISIADPNEVWFMEIIGPGPDGEGAHWVARRIPEGYISCHANKARIGEFPLDDPDSCLYSDNVISFAIEKGYYDPKSGEPFRFCDAYCPSTPGNQRWGDTRVWSIFRRAAPSRNFSADYHRAVQGAVPYPLWIAPDKKLSAGDVFSLMRDHYEGTDYDLTAGTDSGPYGSPYRYRPLDWSVDGSTCAWERPISTQQTGFSFVSQSRSWLPDPVGGVYWYGVDDTFTTCYVPLYCGITDVPPSYTVGRLQEFSWDSAWWVFNFVANYAQLRYSAMVKDVQDVQGRLEETFFVMQPAVERTAIELNKLDPTMAGRYLTDYSVSRGENVVLQWRELAGHLLTKYNDGFVKNEEGRPQEVGYPETWLRSLLSQHPDRFHVEVTDDSVPASRLVD